MRYPFQINSLSPREYASGETRSDLQMKLDGVNIFNFALREVAPTIEAVMATAQKQQQDICYFVLHQANKLILECVRKKLKEPEKKFPYSLYDFGNTSSASIPMTIVTQLQSALRGAKADLVLSGFGVGLSWGSAVIDFDSVVVADLIEI